MFRGRDQMHLATALPPMVGGDQTGLCHPDCVTQAALPKTGLSAHGPRLPSTPPLSHDALRGARPGGQPARGLSPALYKHVQAWVEETDLGDLCQ